MLSITRGPEPHKRSRQEARLGGIKGRNKNEAMFIYQPVYNPLNTDPGETYRRFMIGQVNDLVNMKRVFQGRPEYTEKDRQETFMEFANTSIEEISQTVKELDEEIKQYLVSYN